MTSGIHCLHEPAMRDKRGCLFTPCMRLARQPLRVQALYSYLSAISVVTVNMFLAASIPGFKWPSRLPICWTLQDTGASLLVNTYAGPRTTQAPRKTANKPLGDARAGRQVLSTCKGFSHQSMLVGLPGGDSPVEGPGASGAKHLMG